VNLTASGEIRPKAEPPALGDALYFASDGADVITSNLTAVGRPLPQTIAAYPI
jgi:hypothetical protein